MTTHADIARRNTISSTPASGTVLVAEEDDVARTVLADDLTADQYDVRTASSRQHALSLLAAIPVDVAVVDVNGQTLDLIDAVRTGDGLAGQFDPDTPLIVLTSRVEEVHRIRVLDRGADDVLPKPYSYPELRARIAALLRRAQTRRTPRVLHVGSLTIDAAARTVTVAGERLELPAKEYELLRTLAADPTRVFTREELLSAIWGAGYGMSRTLDSHAARLRRRLADAGAEGLIANTWGVGYALALKTETRS
jgi:DNA-binding response OmpR family regulator